MLIVKITRTWDKWGNHQEVFEIKDEKPFKTRETKDECGNPLKREEYFDIRSMKDLVEKIKLDFFENCTDYATWLITMDAKFKADVKGD